MVRALGCRTRAETGAGNDSQVVLVLNGVPDHVALQRALADLVVQNPVLAGRCRRNPLNLAPYWDVTRPARAEDLCLGVHDIADGVPVSEVLATLSDAVSDPLDGPVRIAFALTRQADRAYLSMRFDHQILDAVGAERLLMRISDGGDRAAAVNVGDRPSHLDQWRDKFRSGQVVNREILALRGEHPPASVPLPAGRRRGVRRTRFMFRTYSASETALINARAETCVGYLLLLPYLLGVSVRALHHVCSRAGIAEGDYVIPVSIDSRAPGSGGDCVFFNHLSFNFYRFNAAAAGEHTALWQQAVEQMYAQVQKRVAYHLANVGMLMRILPAPWLGRLMTLPLGGRLGSMSFALVGREGYTSETFMGVPVEQSFHMPRVPVPPGLGVFFTRYRQKLTLVFSYLDGMLDESAAATFVNEIDAELRRED